MGKRTCKGFVQSQSYPDFAYDTYGCLVCGNWRTKIVMDEDDEEITLPACADNHPQFSVTWRDFGEEEKK